ncbi:hypothetical protein D3C84_678220 [compost metagenome]
MKVVRQAAQRVATEVEHLQRIRQVEDFPGELRQVGGQVQASGASQQAGAQLGKGIHDQIRY